MGGGGAGGGCRCYWQLARVLHGPQIQRSPCSSPLTSPNTSQGLLSTRGCHLADRLSWELFPLGLPVGGLPLGGSPTSFPPSPPDNPKAGQGGREASIPGEPEDDEWRGKPSTWAHQSLTASLQPRQEGQQVISRGAWLQGWAQGSLRSWREFQGIPVLKARGLGKGSRTRRRYGWNTDHRVELEPELETGENPAQAALVLTGPHWSLTSPTSLDPRASGASLSTEEREVGRRASTVIPARARDEQNPEKARVGPPPMEDKAPPRYLAGLCPMYPPQRRGAARTWAVDISLEKHH